MLILNKSNQSLNLCSKKHPPSLGKKLLSGENMEETTRGATEEESQKSTDSLFMLSPPQSAGLSMLITYIALSIFSIAVIHKVSSS